MPAPARNRVVFRGQGAATEPATRITKARSVGKAMRGAFHLPHAVETSPAVWIGFYSSSIALIRPCRIALVNIRKSR